MVVNDSRISSVSAKSKNNMEKSDKEQQQPRNPMSMPPMPPMPRGSDDPWLVFFHGKRGQYQTFYSISEGHNHVETIPCLRRKYICTYGHGWMVSSGRCSDECFLLNPNTMGKIQLPPLDFQFNKCVLSSAPTDPSCTVLFISCPRDDVVIFRFCSPQKSGTAYRWMKKEMTFKDSSGIIDATSCDGKIYALTNRFDEILIIEAVDTTTLTVKKIGIKSWLPSLEESLPFNKVLVESCGELYLVRRIYVDGHKPYEIQDFEVFKMECSTKSWERVKSLGNRAFFLGPDCCMSCFCFAFTKESDTGIMGNTIYFTMAGDKSLYAFNLEEKSISVSFPCPNVQHNWSQPSWVMLPSSGEGFGIQKET